MARFHDVLKWLNQKIGNFFGDFKEDRDLEESPGVCRGITRVLCLLWLLVGFGYGFYRLFTDAPNVEVKRVYLERENANYAIQHMYNSSASYGTDIDGTANIPTSGAASATQEVLDCPCTTTTISWTKYVHFYTISYTLPKPILDWRVDEKLALLYLANYKPQLETLNSSYLSRDTIDLTPETFCNDIVHIWPSNFSSSTFQFFDCLAILSSFLTTKPLTMASFRTNMNDARASYFESPTLDNQKFLYSNTLRRLYAYQQDQYSLYSSKPNFFINENMTYREMSLMGSTELWLYVLHKYAANSSSTDLDFFYSAATRTVLRQSLIELSYPSPFVVVLYKGQTFLGMDINWMDYYKECQPTFCDVTRKNTPFRRTLTSLAQVGGLWGVAVVFVTLIVWPIIAFFLVQFFRRWGGMNKLAEDSKSPVKTRRVLGLRLRSLHAPSKRKWLRMIKVDEIYSEPTQKMLAFQAVPNVVDTK